MPDAMVGASRQSASLINEDVLLIKEDIPSCDLAMAETLVGHERREVLLQAVSIAVPPSVAHLPYPDNLIPLWSPEGLERLVHSAGPFEKLAHHMEGQGMLQCGVTSLTIALNVCRAPERQPFTIDFLQEEFRKTVRPVNTFFSTSLREIGDLASRFAVAESVHASDTDCASFRHRASATLKASGCVIVNFKRATLGYDSPFGGHCSPLAAYDATTDEFLVMDVARKTWQPVWVPTGLLFDGMNTLDEPRCTAQQSASNVCQVEFSEQPYTEEIERATSRGFILVSPAECAPLLQQSIYFLPWYHYGMWASLSGFENLLALPWDEGCPA